MADERLKKYRNQKQKINEVKHQIKELTSVKQKKIDKEQDEIILLKKHEALANLTYDLYDDVKEDKLDEMENNNFDSLIAIGDYMMSSSVTYTTLIKNEEPSVLKNVKSSGTLDATASTLWSGNRRLIEFSKENSAFFNDPESIVKEYDPGEDFNEQIDYIKTQLPSITPDISSDFDNFIKNFLSNDSNDTKYQELIGFRSSLILKVIFPFSEKKFGKNKSVNRKLDIERFVCNGKILDSEDEPIITRLYDLYKFLSTDVKEGKTNHEENENAFYESVSVTYAILKLKEKYIKMS